MNKKKNRSDEKIDNEVIWAATREQARDPLPVGYLHDTNNIRKDHLVQLVSERQKEFGISDEAARLIYEIIIERYSLYGRAYYSRQQHKLDAAAHQKPIQCLNACIEEIVRNEDLYFGTKDDSD